MMIFWIVGAQVNSLTLLPELLINRHLERGELAGHGFLAPMTRYASLLHILLKEVPLNWQA